MKYMLQVRFNGADLTIGNSHPTNNRRSSTEFEALQQLPGVLDGNQLQPAGTATTVRIHDGQTDDHQ